MSAPHLAILPVLVPFVSAFACLLLGGRTRQRHRIVGVVATLTSLVIAVLLVARTGTGEYLVYRPGDWPAPFGIVLVADRLSALMLLLTDLVALGSILYAVNGGDTAGRHFHAFLQLQLAGLHGAFLTGDLFNLFVFFEILLIASYCLLVFGGGERRTRAGVHYVVLNLVGSALFLIAVGTIYGVTGALNMAHLSVRVAELPASSAAVLRAAGLLLMVVFAIKAAIAPLYFWLPNAYASASAPVAALFAIMTKVGVYAIVRVYTLIFGPLAGVGADLALPWLLPAALVTSVLGFAGALAARTLRVMIGYLLIASVGTMLAGVGLFTREGLAGALYYLVHSVLTFAVLYLVADLVVRQRGAEGDALIRAPRLREPMRIGALYFLAAVAAIGLPPLAGFLGKALILAAAPHSATGAWLWGVLLGGSLVALVALTRAGITIFWHVDEDATTTAPPSSRRLVPAAGLAVALVALTVLAGPVAAYTTATAEQLLAPDDYVTSVLGGP